MTVMDMIVNIYVCVCVCVYNCRGTWWHNLFMIFQVTEAVPGKGGGEPGTK